MRENQYQAKLIKELNKRFPECMVIKNDPSYYQGILDLLILFEGGRWAMLEVKASATSRYRPNQLYYVDKFNKMGYAAVIYPENESEILDELEAAFSRPRR